MASDDLYNILGCNKQSTPDEIKKAYKKLALHHHPDKNNGNDDMFKKINEAYSVLSNPEKKSNYDRFGSADEPRGGGHPFQDFQSFFSGGFPFHFNQFNAGGRQPHRQSSRKCSNLQLTIDITLEDVFNGVSILHTYDQPVGCNCVTVCSQCRGQGVIMVIQQMGMMRQSIQMDCNICSKKGFQPVHNCELCKGKGQQMVKKQIKINGPRGLDTGNSITLQGGGEKPPPHMNNIYLQPGDLQITLNVKEHPTFKRQGNNLVYTHTLDWIDSVCGKEIQIPLFDGPFVMQTNDFGIVYPTKTYTIANKGLFDTQNIRGELHIQFTINQPIITSEQSVLLREAIKKCIT